MQIVPNGEALNQKAVVLLSGGLDSAVCLWKAKEAGWILYTITYNFHLRHSKEIQAAEKLAEKANAVEHRTVDLPFLKEIKDSEIDSSHPLHKILDKVSSAYIPMRNTAFYAIASSWAESLGAKYVVGGHIASDHASFPDSTPEYFQLFNRLLKTGSWTGRVQPIRVVTPLSGLTKADVVREAVRLKVPLELTWSCYERGEKACGRCPACVSRLKAFQSAGVKDPVEYEYSAPSTKL